MLEREQSSTWSSSQPWGTKDWSPFPYFLGYINPRLQGQTQGRGYGSWQIMRLFLLPTYHLFTTIVAQLRGLSMVFSDAIKHTWCWQSTWRIKSSLERQPRERRKVETELSWHCSGSLLTLGWVPELLGFLSLLAGFGICSCYWWKPNMKGQHWGIRKGGHPFTSQLGWEEMDIGLLCRGNPADKAQAEDKGIMRELTLRSTWCAGEGFRSGQRLAGAKWVLTNPPGDSDAHQSLRTTLLISVSRHNTPVLPYQQFSGNTPVWNLCQQC